MFKNVIMIQNPSRELIIKQQIEDDMGNTHIKYDQYYNGLKVFGPN